LKLRDLKKWERYQNGKWRGLSKATNLFEFPNAKRTSELQKKGKV